MLPNKLKISQSAAETARILKQRTGLTPNVTCRIALMLSLETGPAGGMKKTDQLGSEFNAPTLFGDLGNAIEAMLVEVHGPRSSKETVEIIASHIEDGLTPLRKAKNLLEFIDYCGAATSRAD